MATDLTKIATCCYCGSRTVLRFDAAMHELTCRSCGAALHHMKPMKTAVVSRPQPSASLRKAPKKDLSDFLPKGKKGNYSKPKKKRPKKRRRGFDFEDFLGDALEEVFDIFD